MTRGESVNTAWWRQAVNSSPWPFGHEVVGVLVADAAHDQSGGDGVLAAAGGERGERHLGVADPLAELLVEDRVWVPDYRPRILTDGGDRPLHRDVLADSDREPGLRSADCDDDVAAVERRVRPHHQQPARPAGSRVDFLSRQRRWRGCTEIRAPGLAWSQAA